MPRLDLIVGPVGAGKSTTLRRLVKEQNYVGIEMDAYLFKSVTQATQGYESKAQFLRAYSKYSSLILPQIWRDITEALRSGRNVAFEFGLMQREARTRFYRLVDTQPCELRVLVLDAPFEERLRRVKKRNITQGGITALRVSDELFEAASRLWQPPQGAELSARKVVFMPSDEVHI